MLILVAEDDPDTALLVSSILKRAGYTTLTARDAMQVMHLAAHRKPDLIILDLLMPAGTGVGALDKLKLSVNTMDIPVIVLSGVRDELMREQVLRMGALTFLSKPVDPDALIEAVRAVVGGDDSAAS